MTYRLGRKEEHKHTGKPKGVAVSHCITWFQTQLIRIGRNLEWRNLAQQIVPHFIMVFKNSCQILPAPNCAMPVTKFSTRIFFA